ncbi:lysophospholipid acyltransferase family protein [Amorphus coralli]|uniref:lysophospholipid acyltransferase family protein n=1 Tax=Amorphus coralli TaxID=340680 RepID=UPI00036EC055|nr:hypothetical protein [Amorphus coralli]
MTITSPDYPPPFGPLRMRAEYAGLRAALLPIRAMPLETASAISGTLWRAVAPRLHRHSRVREHLAFAFPELSEDARERIALDSWENLGRVTAEGAHVDRFATDLDRFELPDDVERYRRLARTGCVFVSLHLGNWEIAALPALGKNVSVAGTYQAIQNPLVDRYIRSLRLPLYAGGLYPKGHATSRKLVSIVRSGGSVGFLADLRERRGIKVTFFDRPAYANPFPASLARMAGYPIVAGCMVRTGGVRFRLHLKEIEQTRSGDRALDVRETTQSIHDVFEYWIRQYPGQWMWSHRKWALRPEDMSSGEAAAD